MPKPQWIMVAGPYRSGAASPEEQARNLEAMNVAALAVFDKGHVPIIGVNLALPIIRTAPTDRYEEIMMPLSLAAAERCDAVLRIGGASGGADAEVERIRGQGGLVYESLEDIPDIT